MRLTAPTIKPRTAKLAGVLIGLLLILGVPTWAPIRNPVEDALFDGAGGRGCFGQLCDGRACTVTEALDDTIAATDGSYRRMPVVREYPGTISSGACIANDGSACSLMAPSKPTGHQGQPGIVIEGRCLPPSTPTTYRP